MGPKIFQFKGVCDYFVLCRMFGLICVLKHEQLTKQNFDQNIAHEHERKSRVSNKPLLPQPTKSRCQNALIFRCIKLCYTTPNDIKQSANLARFKKDLKRFILSSSDGPEG